MGNNGADIAVIGLAVMGQNLVLNMADNGWDVSVFNRTPNKTSHFVEGVAADSSVTGYYDLESLVGSLERPRKVMLMIKAGAPVDSQIEALLPHLEAGDVVIDGGNSLFTDTQRRCDALAERGIHFVGTGISGGEEGARHGPSMMPGGDSEAWPLIGDLFRSIAATADGEPMADWVGPGGSGHFVKMVHNGIEYGDMQVIAEAYDIMRRGLGMTAAEQQAYFARWNTGVLDSYLIEITADILSHTENGTPTVERILDTAGQKGTGKWTVVASMDEAVPVTLVGESVYARMVSALKDERVFASERLGGAIEPIAEDREKVVADLHDALYGSKIVSYAQGFMLIQAASDDRGWNLDPGTIAGLWRAGCIIRSRFLADITKAFRANPNLRNLLLDEFFADEIRKALPGWRRTVARAVTAGVPTPAYSSALAFYDSYRSADLPANLIQAQRDYFGAHMYERTDRPRGEWFHSGLDRSRRRRHIVCLRRMTVKWPRAMPALITAFDADGSVDLAANRSNIAVVRDRGARGVLLAGSTGQGPYLEPGERTTLAQLAKDADPELVAICGVHAETTRTAIAACIESVEGGADAVLVTTPTTLVRGREAPVGQFYLDVADEAAVPVFLYSVPKVTGWALPTESVLRLAEHPNIVGIKDSGGDPDRVDAMRSAIRDGFVVYVGASRALAPSAMHGSWGAITASANYALTEVGLAARGDTAAQSRLLHLTSVVEPYGLPGTTYAAERCGLDTGTMRRPLLPLDAEGRNAIDHALATAGLGISKDR